MALHLSHSYKVLAKIVQERIHTREEEIMSEEQAGFRTSRGTIDHIFTFNQIVEKMWERGKDKYCVFISFKQDFDSVWREGMVRVLEQWGLETDITNTVSRLYGNTTSRVKKGNITTNNFPTTGGVIKGYPLSPHIFNLYLEWVVRTALDEMQEGIKIGGLTINNMKYADDIEIMGESRQELQRMVDVLGEQYSRYKLNINAEKKKFMKIGIQRENLKYYIVRKKCGTADGI